MPDVDAVRARLPVSVISDKWQCCGTKGVTLFKAEGRSNWMIRARCNTCSKRYLILKRGMRIYKPSSTDLREESMHNPSGCAACLDNHTDCSTVRWLCDCGCHRRFRVSIKLSDIEFGFIMKEIERSFK